MPIYIVTYDLNRPGQNYDLLYGAIKGVSSDYIRPLKSLWMLNTPMSASAIYDRLINHIDQTDRILVSKLTHDHMGFLNKNDCNWLASRMALAA